MAQAFADASHPYFPQNAQIPTYVPNTSSLGELLVRSGSILSVTIITAVWVACRFSPRLPLADKFVYGWFILCEYRVAFHLRTFCKRLTQVGGLLHCFFEGGWFTLDMWALIASACKTY